MLSKGKNHTANLTLCTFANTITTYALWLGIWLGLRLELVVELV